MSHNEANENRANPNYVKGNDNGYNKNCQSCVVAYELRRRGFNVEALLRIPGDTLNIPVKLAYYTEMIWRDFDGNIPVSINAKGDSIEKLNDRFNELTKEVGRYHIKWTWDKYTERHIVVCERFKKGGLRIYDPQTGKTIKWTKELENISLKDGIDVLKVDKLLVDTSIVNKIVKAVL